MILCRILNMMEDVPPKRPRARQNIIPAVEAVLYRMQVSGVASDFVTNDYVTDGILSTRKDRIGLSANRIILPLY